MRTTRLADTAVETSILGLGCAGLFRDPSRSGRRRLLEGAFDAGIRYFDVAPMYGLGRAESELGRFARGRRDRVAIATKFGIAPSLAARLLARAQGPLHRLLAAAPAARERARPALADPRDGTVGSALYRAPGYDARAARSSLERSLRQLNTDYVDVLLLHDPRPGDVRSDDVRGYLESARSQGLVRAWGVAGETEPTLAAAARLGPAVPILQVRDDVFLRTVRGLRLDPGQATIRFATLARALPRISSHLRSNPDLRRRWSDAVGSDCARADVIASLLIRDALREAPDGLVLFSSVQPEHVAVAVAAVEAAQPADPSLDAFRGLLVAELGAPEIEP